MDEIMRAIEAAERRLSQGGQPGLFVPRDGVIDWRGDRRNRADAERALIDALAFRGISAHSVPGLGVRVDRDEVRPFGDHEAALHNAEPSEETMAECGAAAE
jgi:hypothetical protein